MSPDTNHPFRQLEPPPGGAERFRRHLDALDAPLRAPRRRLALAATCAAVLAVALLVAFDSEELTEPRVASVYDAPELDRLLGRPLEPAQTAVSIDDEPSSVSELPSSDSRIRIYEID